jgi:hypothetical protein
MKKLNYYFIMVQNLQQQVVLHVACTDVDVSDCVCQVFQQTKKDDPWSKVAVVMNTNGDFDKF